MSRAGRERLPRATAAAVRDHLASYGDCARRMPRWVRSAAPAPVSALALATLTLGGVHSAPGCAIFDISNRKWRSHSGRVR